MKHSGSLIPRMPRAYLLSNLTCPDEFPWEKLSKDFDAVEWYNSYLKNKSEEAARNATAAAKNILNATEKAADKIDTEAMNFSNDFSELVANDPDLAKYKQAYSDEKPMKAPCENDYVEFHKGVAGNRDMENVPDTFSE
jgi:hypothetical protein